MKCPNDDEIDENIGLLHIKIKATRERNRLSLLVVLMNAINNMSMIIFVRKRNVNPLRVLTQPYVNEINAVFATRICKKKCFTDRDSTIKGFWTQPKTVSNKSSIRLQ